MPAKGGLPGCHGRFAPSAVEPGVFHGTPRAASRAGFSGATSTYTLDFSSTSTYGQRGQGRSWQLKQIPRHGGLQPLFPRTPLSLEFAQEPHISVCVRENFTRQRLLDDRTTELHSHSEAPPDGSSGFPVLSAPAKPTSPAQVPS